MDFLTIVAVALGLSFDTFALSFSYGVIKNGILFREAFKIAFFLGFSRQDYLSWDIFWDLFLVTCLKRQITGLHSPFYLFWV